MGRLEHPYAWLFCAFAALGACLYGYDGVYFTGVSAMDIFIEHFGTPKADGSGYEIKASDLSVMTSMINVGELVGSLTAAPLNDFLGRKGVFLIGAATVIVGVVLQLATDHSHAYIIGGRVILGYGVGAFSSTSPLYIGEVAPTHIRGPLLMCWQLTLSVSQIVAAAINRGTESLRTTAAYRVPMAVQLVFPLLVLAFWWWVPESPRWLLRKGRHDSCDAALRLIHREDKAYSPQRDVQALQKDLDDEAALSRDSSWADLVRDPIERRKVVYSAGALIAQQINGIQWFYYFGTVFSKAIGLEDPFLMTLIVFIIQVVVVFAAVLCANKIPRRPLLLITTVIMTISIFIVGCLGIPGGDVSKTFGKVIISFVIIEITAFNFAWGPLGWTIASEMAVGRNRNKIYAIAVACFWVTVWVTVFTLPYLYYSADLGPKTGFVYTGLCFVSLAYVWFCVGEVTGRTMEEINDFFMKGIPARKWAEQPRLPQPEDGGSDTVEVANENAKHDYA
ncbi:Sugar/inositol transporter [Neofusicoccum parvum]|uniref:Putative sugar transporter protein n=1 Tax=Botryosphaeria parva (strain UCR-NP2) TaxID=1287680 RepID=R1GRP0_BOTPV|nr:putative sugar transporter protein [Neofusicoccum parvum UCRNP2]GME64033.1 Sugar/inositol transporter [Neofusicoccum parvum]